MIYAQGGIQGEETSFIEPLFLENIYPNPVKGTFKINFHIQAEQKVVVKLYDVSGRLVEKVFDGMSKSGVNEITIKTDKLCAGIYFISIEVGREIIARKVILFK